MKSISDWPKFYRYVAIALVLLVVVAVIAYLTPSYGYRVVIPFSVVVSVMIMIFVVVFDEPMVRLTALEQSLSGIAPTLSVAGITRLALTSSDVAEIGFGSAKPLSMTIPASVSALGFPVYIYVRPDSLVIKTMETTPLPSSFDDAEAFIRALAEHSIATIQSREQYVERPAPDVRADSPPKR